MSHFTRIRTELRDIETVRRALEDMGYQVEEGQVRGFMHQRAQADKIREIVEWLEASDVTDDDGFDFITAEWESYDAIDVRASGYYDIED